MDAVPPSWTKRAYPSELGLNSWFTDMLYRINELSNWTADFNVNIYLFFHYYCNFYYCIKQCPVNIEMFQFVKLTIEFVGNFDAWNSTQTGKINIGKLNERQNKTSVQSTRLLLPIKSEILITRIPFH